MSVDSHEQIMYKLGEISGGIREINKRLDKVNGRIDKNEDKIDKLESFTDNLKGKVAMISSTAGIIMGLITSFLADKFK